VGGPRNFQKVRISSSDMILNLWTNRVLISGYLIWAYSFSLSGRSGRLVTMFR